MSTVERLHHVSIPRPPGDAAHRRAIAFYEGVLGLRHISKPSTFTDIDVTWFALGNTEVHLYAREADDPAPAPGAHFCLIVADLTAMRARLESLGHDCTTPTPIPGRPRFNSHDPFGNQIEFTALEA